MLKTSKLEQKGQFPSTYEDVQWLNGFSNDKLWHTYEQRKHSQSPEQKMLITKFQRKLQGHVWS